MSRSKKETFKKLKTKRVWPSVMLFFITLFFMLVMLMYISAILIVREINSEFINSYNKVAYVADIMEESYSKGEDFDNTLMKLTNMNVFVVDKDKNAVAGVGKFTADLGNNGAFLISDIYKLYVDKEQNYSDNLFIANDDYMTLNISEIVSYADITSNNFMSAGGEVLYSVPCWMDMNADMGEYELMIKTEINIMKDDVVYIMISCLMAAVIMVIPLVIMLGNVISAVRVQGKLKRIIYYDEITGGNNWSYFRMRGKKLLSGFFTRNMTYAIVDIEFMKYRSFCACHGVEEGERVLEGIYNHINSRVRNQGVCARYSKADFAVMIPCTDSANAKSIIRSLIDGMTDIAGCHRAIFHAGYYISGPTVNENGRAVMRKNADVAEMFNSASAARASIMSKEENEVAEFSTTLLENQLWEHKVEDEMQSALDNREFEVYYQPKYNPVTEKLAGAEALIRWIKPDGIIPPGKFIPIFEKNGFITKIDDYMIDSVARQQEQWHKEGKHIVPVSVNVSRAHFSRADLAEHIRSIVDRYDIPHKYIEIELTESAFFDDKNALLTTVKQLKDLGFEISMDDFGAGYSSLNSLKDLPLDVLKLDADFFRGEGNDNRAEIIISSAIALAKHLDMRIVAEGIEKKDQVDFLAEAGCDMIQGYYYAKPMPAGDYVLKMEQ